MVEGYLEYDHTFERILNYDQDGIMSISSEIKEYNFL